MDGALFKKETSERKMNKTFFSQDAEKVARALLGKTIVRNINGKERRARIVETEAYYNEKDPASRACKNGDLRETMLMNAGTILVYGVHNQWLINFVTGKEGEAEAVLLRALEPLNFSEKCSGPGLLTRALQINKKFHKQSILDSDELFVIDGNGKKFDVVESNRIGVKKDLKKKLRFYVKGNEHVSRK